MSTTDVHKTKDGNFWHPATFKGSDVWVRVVSADDPTHFIGVGERVLGKKCIIYRRTPSPPWYWVTGDLVLPRAPADAGSSTRRSKRGRPAEEVAAEEEAERARPRVATNGKLYGVVHGSEDRREFVRGNNNKDKCAKCNDTLPVDEYLGFIEGERQKTVRKVYGGDSRRNWSGQFEYTERDFFHLHCWEVPKTAQKSLRGLVDVVGFDDVSDAQVQRELLGNQLSHVYGAMEHPALKK